MLHRLQTSIVIPVGREKAFAFFSDPANLAQITPASLRFHVRTPGTISIRQGTLIEYGLRVFGVPLRWRSVISRWDPPSEFVDEQLAGPYRRWVHTHRFIERSGGTSIEDLVRYELPCQPLGELGYPLVRRQLARIFRFRQQAIERILSPADPTGADQIE